MKQVLKNGYHSLVSSPINTIYIFMFLLVIKSMNILLIKKLGAKPMQQALKFEHIFSCAGSVKYDDDQRMFLEVIVTSQKDLV